MGYNDSQEKEVLACEVKKTSKEIDILIDLMSLYASDSSIAEPAKGPERNAFKKVMGIRESWPSVFWALGPNGYGKLFKVNPTTELEFNLIEHDISKLNMRTVSADYNQCACPDLI